jgi:hypothetical protein
MALESTVSTVLVTTWRTTDKDGNFADAFPFEIDAATYQWCRSRWREAKLMADSPERDALFNEVRFVMDAAALLGARWERPAGGAFEAPPERVAAVEEQMGFDV